MREILVLGIGNRLMMDDGIGVYVVETLKEKNTNSGIQYISGETDIYFCLNQIEEAQLTFIVDAALLDKEPGTIRTIPFKEILKSPIKTISIHDSHLLNELKMINKSVNGIFIGIEPYAIDYYFGLSPVLQANYFKIVDEIENIITTNL